MPIKMIAPPDKLQDNQFIVIGENLHTTRVLKRNSIRAKTMPDGTEVIAYRDAGELKTLKIPPQMMKTQPFKQGNVKHFMAAVWNGVDGDTQTSCAAAEYVLWEARRQQQYGADYLDVNVDEASHRIEEQKAYMRWMVNVLQTQTLVPLSVDSSSIDVIEVGLAAYKDNQQRCILNSASLERLEALNLAKAFNTRVVVTTAGDSRMPSDAAERVENAGRIVERALSLDIAKEDLFIDPLFFPIAVSSAYGTDALSAIAIMRKEFGPEVHITGGISNISFGIPRRKLVNAVFLRMTIKHGADSAIVDPIQCRKSDIFSEIDASPEAVALASNMLYGNDPFCMEYISAYREGRI